MVKPGILCNVVSIGEELSRSFVAGDILPGDAALIASSPDLLEALEATREALWNMPGTPTLAQVKCVGQADAAIAKAKGQP